MSDTVIQVENLSKSYVLSHRGTRGVGNYQRFGDAILQAAQAPFRAFGKRRESTPEREIFWAVRDVTFEVKRGDVIGIIGRNGAGKSTLLKILSRITEPTKGRVEIEGRVASLLEVGTGFHPELTGRENIFLNGAILGMSRREIRGKFDEIVDFAEVEQFLDTPVKRYSSGMYVRLAFAVAAHLEPEILVVDEVLAVGDAQFQKKCLGKMQDVSTKEGRTVLFVSHNMAAVSNLCTTALLMERGRLREIGEVSVVSATYASSVSAIDSFSLTDASRRGAGQTKFTKLWIEDTAGNHRVMVSSGEKVVVAMEYASKGSKVLRNIRASLCLTDSLGQILFNASTELTAPGTHNLPANGIIRCVLNRIPLSGGAYIMQPYLEINGVTEDHVENAGNLRVEDGDFYGSGKLYPAGWQGKGVLIDHSWRFPSA